MSYDWVLTQDENVLKKMKSIIHKRNRFITELEKDQRKEYDFINDKKNKMSSKEYSLGCSTGLLLGLENERRSMNLLLQIIESWETYLERQ
jgi:hypothetical protein